MRPGKEPKKPEHRMLYRSPGLEMHHGVSCDVVVVDVSEVSAKLAEGWHRSPTEAFEAATAPVVVAEIVAPTTSLLDQGETEPVAPFSEQKPAEDASIASWKRAKKGKA